MFNPYSLVDRNDPLVATLNLKDEECLLGRLYPSESFHLEKIYNLKQLDELFIKGKFKPFKENDIIRLSPIALEAVGIKDGEFVDVLFSYKDKFIVMEARKDELVSPWNTGGISYYDMDRFCLRKPCMFAVKPV